MPSDDTIRVILADDHQLMREGLRSLFNDEPKMEVVAEAENGRDAVRLAHELRPDVVVMDIAMPELNGIEATRQIKAKLPEVKVVALSMHTDKRFVVEILRAGASAYLLKDSAFLELKKAIGEVMTDHAFLSPAVTGAVIGNLLDKAGDASVLAELTGREREVMQLLAEGRSTREVADRLHLSVKTIDTHRHHMMQKLGISSIAELTKVAIREGLTTLED